MLSEGEQNVVKTFINELTGLGPARKSPWAQKYSMSESETSIKQVKEE